MCSHALGEIYAHVDDRTAIADTFAAGNPDLTDRLLLAHMADAVVRLATGAPAPAAHRDVREPLGRVRG